MSIFKQVHEQATTRDAANDIVKKVGGTSDLSRRLNEALEGDGTGMPLVSYNQAILTIAKMMVDKFRGGADDYRVHGLDLVAKIYGTSEEQVINDAQEVFDQLLAGNK